MLFRSNPYTAVATVLQAALLGYEGKYPLQPLETGDGFTGNDAAHGTAANLTEALEDLAADSSLSNAVEVGKTETLEPDALRDWYIWYL